MEIFRGQNFLEFITYFNSDEKSKAYLACLKWDTGYRCIKCSHKGCQIRSNYSRTFNKCSHTESAGANILFHKVKFGLQKAFLICFEMSTTTKSLSANYMGKRYGVTEKTARLFMHKVREAMKSKHNYPMKGKVEVDEFVFGGKETGKVGRSYDAKKKKAVCAVEYTDEGKVKRIYALKINNYSAKELAKYLISTFQNLLKLKQINGGDIFQ